MKKNKLYFFVMILLSSLRVIGDTVNFSAIVLDDITGNPLPNVSVGAGFTMDAGPVWENRFKYDHKQFITDARGITSISFLYYLNPTPLDRNLEWDMKTNLCLEPGVINSPRAP